MRSGIPPTRVATTGTPAAIASMTACGNPSKWLGKRKTSLSRRTRRTSSRPSQLVAFIELVSPRAWTTERNSRAQNAAGAIHSDLEKHFIRAETIHWDKLLEAGSEANAKNKGWLRLEGKEYIVQDGDVMHIRHSG